MAEGKHLQLKRGTHATIGTLSVGELGYETDTYKVFVGDGATNHEVGGGGSFTGGTLTSALITADHGTAATGEVVCVCYGTGSPPTASTVPEGSLFVKYTA